MSEENIMEKQNTQNLWRIYVKLKAKFTNEPADRDLVKECYENGWICIGWGGAMYEYWKEHNYDYAKWDRSELEDAICKAYGADEMGEKWYSDAADALYQFCTEIKKGDKIIMRGQEGTEDYKLAYVGRVVSDYYFHKTAETEDYWNFFNVAWEKTPINIEAMECGEGKLRNFIFCMGNPLKNLNSRSDEVRKLIKK